MFSPDIARILSDDRPWRPAPGGPPRRRARRRPVRDGLHALAPRLRAAGVHLRATKHLRRRAA